MEVKPNSLVFFFGFDKIENVSSLVENLLLGVLRAGIESHHYMNFLNSLAL